MVILDSTKLNVVYQNYRDEETRAVGNTYNFDREINKQLNQLHAILCFMEHLKGISTSAIFLMFHET